MQHNEISLREYLQHQYPDYTDADREIAYDNLMALAGFIVQSNVHRTEIPVSLTERKTSPTMEDNKQ